MRHFDGVVGEFCDDVFVCAAKAKNKVTDAAKKKAELEKRLQVMRLRGVG